MATTRLAVRNRVREMLGDQDPAEQAVSRFRYDGSISRNMYLVAARAAMPRSTVQSVALSVAGGYEYSGITDTVKRVTQVFLNSTGAELGFVPWEQFNAYYKQDTAIPLPSGTPREYTMRESVSAGLVMRFGPTPSATDSAKVHLSILPSTLASDTTSIAFSDELAWALASFVAAEIVSSLSEEKLNKLGVPRSSATLWLTQGEQGIKDHNRRQSNLGARQSRIMRGGGRRVQVNA